MVIKVVHIFGKLDRNGAETMLMNLYRNIDREKINFDFVVHSDVIGDYEAEILKMGGKIFRCPRYKGKNHFAYISWWKNFFKSNHYDILHSHIRSTASLYLPIYRKYNGGVCIAHSHSTSSGKGMAALIKNVLQYPLRYQADYLFACSDEAGKWLFGKHACKKRNYFVVKNAIDCDRYVLNAAKRKEYRLRYDIEDRFVIGHVGRFTRAKNHAFIIDLFQKIHSAEPKATLLLVGRGEEEEAIHAKIRRYGLEQHVIFAGNVEDVAGILQAMDVYVMPSLWEGLGISLIEAQAAGLPCVCSEHIPPEAILTEHCHQIRLADENAWEETVLRQKSFKAEAAIEQIRKAGYDIKDTAIWIQNFYCKVIKTNG